MIKNTFLQLKKLHEIIILFLRFFFVELRYYYYIKLSKLIDIVGISSACNQLGMAISYLIGPAVVGNTVARNTTPSTNNTNFNGTVDFDKMYSVVLRAQITSLMRIGMFFKDLYINKIIFCLYKIVYIRYSSKQYTAVY